MGLLQKVSLVASASIAAFAVGMVAATPAQAALFKFSFEGEGASGYFIFDDTTEKIIPEGQPSTELSWEYYASVVEYSVSIDGSEGQITEQGQKGSQTDETNEARNVVYLSRPESSGYEGTNVDDFILFIPKALRGGQYGLSVRFSYPEGTLSSEGDLPTSVPSTATLKAYPYWDFPVTTGYSTFSGTVTTRLEKIPEPASSLALLVMGGALFIFCRQSKQVIPLKALKD
ncbi:hypothetical protein [Mastigocladopsis repens]|uniref:hypothetical protein n=1 Tax=Mastigocladopsis repens TaxID=221287 RepID=UPI000307E66A|nr:hypothetical protein [Mastigocladopsis repens]